VKYLGHCRPNDKRSIELRSKDFADQGRCAIPKPDCHHLADCNAEPVDQEGELKDSDSPKHSLSQNMRIGPSGRSSIYRMRKERWSCAMYRWARRPSGGFYSILGKHAEAEEMHRQTLATRTSGPGAEHLDTLWTRHSLTHGCASSPGMRGISCSSIYQEIAIPKYVCGVTYY